MESSDWDEVVESVLYVGDDDVWHQLLVDVQSPSGRVISNNPFGRNILEHMLLTRSSSMHPHEAMVSMHWLNGVKYRLHFLTSTGISGNFVNRHSSFLQSVGGSFKVQKLPLLSMEHRPNWGQPQREVPHFLSICFNLPMTLLAIQLWSPDAGNELAHMSAFSLERHDSQTWPPLFACTSTI